MSSNLDSDAILLLNDGTVFRGRRAGAKGTTTGEICFNTGMTGYQEVFTDPSYHGQILVSTNVHVGNYGIKEDEQESSKLQITGLVCRDFCDKYSRPMATSSIQEYFEQQQFVGITGVDTRAIVRHIRNKGAMNAIISSEIFDIRALRHILDKTPSMEGLELASRVSTQEQYEQNSQNGEFKVAVLDLGVKRNILKCLTDRGAHLKVFNAKTSFAEMESWQPDAYFISNGPGDPASMEYAIQTVQKIIETDRPLFGICLGHQIICLSMGLKTAKMHNGHRGCNHPILNLQTSKGEITSQNHGFTVDMESAKANDKVEITHINLNDQSLEGIRIKGKNAFSVQYHPEASPGPHDSRYLFDDFIKLIQSTLTVKS